MARRNNSKDQAEQNLKLIADQNEKLDLIKVNVDNVKKDVSDISVFTQKQISAIGKALDKELKKFDELQKRVKEASGNINEETQKSLKNTISNIDILTNNINKVGQAQKQINAENAKELERLEKQKQKELDDITKSKRETYAKGYINRAGTENQRSQNLAASISSGRIGEAFSAFASKGLNNKISNNNDAMEDLVTSFKEGKISRNKFENGVKEFTKSTSKYTAATNALSILGDTLDKAVKIWIDRFSNGMNKIIQEYEKVFTSQAVMTGISQREYQQWQNEAVANLTSQGLQNNIAISDVMEQTSQFVNSGITNFAKASELGQSQAIRNVLAPYLDQNSEAITSLELSMPGIANSLSGIGSYVSDTVGQNRFTVKNLQELINLTEPVSLAAKKDLLGAEGIAMIEDLVAGGMDMTSATKMATDIAQAVADPLGAGLESGNVAIASAIASGERDFTGIASSAMRTQASLQAGTDGDLGTAAMLQATGGWGTYNYNATEEFNRVLGNLESGKYENGSTTSGGGVDTSQNYEELMQKLSNDQLQVTKEMKNILGENIATGLATIAERFPDTWEVIKSVGGAIVNAILLWAGSKLIGGIGGKITGGAGKAGSLLSKAGSAVGGGLTKLGAGGIKGIATGTTSGVATTAGGVASGLATVGGAVAGGAMAVKGGSDVINDFKNNDVSWKTAASGVGAAGGAVGAGALLALGASNPVGWVALAVGGAALGIRAFGEMMEEQKEALGDSMTQYSKEIDNEMKEREKEQDKQMRQLSIVREQVNRTSDLETAKQILAESGIATETELQKAQYNSKEALLKLTDQYIESTKKMNEESNQITKGLKTMAAQEKSDYVNATKDFMSYIVKGVGQKKMYQMDDSERALTEETIRAVAAYGNENYDKLDDNQKKIVDKIRATGSGDGIGLNWEEIDSIVNEMDNHKTEMGTLINAALGTDSILQEFTTNTSAMQRLGNKSQYLGFDTDKAANYLIQASQEGISDEKARDLLDDFKAVTMLNSIDDISDQNVKNKINEIVSTHNLGSYKGGTDYVSADGALFMAHEGEAVLTQPAAALLRSSTDSDISTVQGVSDALSTSSSLTREGFNSVVSAISDQTSQLVAKMDQILSIISNGRVGSTYNNKLVDLKGGLTPNAQ